MYLHFREICYTKGVFMNFEWDNGNVPKLLTRFAISELEEFFYQELLVIKDDLHSMFEERFIAVGLGREQKPMFVAFTIRDSKIRVISARYMRDKEVVKYEKFKKNF
jgi:uncharacterized DUF497 family protein